jgi:hypothetical protein
MTSDERPRFESTYRKLAASLSAKPPDSDALEAAYYDAAHFPLVVVEAALEALRTTSRFMPRPVQLIGACQEQARRHASHGGSIPPWVNHDEARYFCDVCDDTGFERRLECPGTGVCRITGCGAEGHRNGPHTFTRPCHCRTTNPVLAVERDKLRRPADGDRSAA